MLKAWGSVRGYSCTYRAVTVYEGKTTETLSRTSYQKPGRLRMDIQKPKAGAVLIYNPDASANVRVRPFPRLPFFVLDYPLTHARVTSGSGGTLDRSDLGHRMRQICADIESGEAAPGPGRTIEVREKDGTVKRHYLDERFFLRKTEVFKSGELADAYEWIDLQLDPTFPPDHFEKF